MIRIDILHYAASHGHTPRQPRGYPVSPWAFQIDCHPEPVYITARYQGALQQAKTLAQHTVTVLP
jgi:hypothetical protein